MKELLRKMLGERTLVLIKPDAVKKGLIGIIIQRFEQAGFKIVACKMILATREQLEGHFPKSEEWIRRMGKNTLEAFQENEFDPIKILGTADAYEIGQKIKEWNYRYLMDGPIMVIVLEGVHAIDTVRKLIGHTSPYKALPGTIRGDFSIDSPVLANIMKRAVKNIVHASGTPEEAKQEITNWFGRKQRKKNGKEVIDTMQQHLSLKALEQKLEDLRETDPRNAAEYAYALAMLYKQEGNNEQAIQFGKEAIGLFDKCLVESLQDCAGRNMFIAGVPIPGLIHQNVVRENLQPLTL